MFLRKFNFRYGDSTDRIYILVFGDKLVFCRRSLIKLDEIILSKGKPLLVRVIYSDIYLTFDIASFVTRMLKYNIGLNIFAPSIHYF